MSDTDATLTVAERRKLLLQQKLRAAGLATATTQSVERIEPGERRPLTPGQRRMWFLQTRDAADTALNICVAYRLTGPLDVDRLHAAFDTVVANHDILRTTYGVDADGEPFQTFAADKRAEWTTVDLTAVVESARDLRVEVLAQREFSRPFDLATDATIRALVLKTGPAQHVLALTIHHISFDDDSWAIFFAELNAAYQGTRPGGSVQFAAIAPTTEPAEADVDYWRTVMRPVPEPLELPGSPVATPGRQAARATTTLDKDLVARTEAFARAHSATPFMVLLSAFDVLIHRYTAADDFLVSVPVTDRPAGTEHLIGYFGNTLLLRATLAGTESFADLLVLVRDTCTDSFARRSVGIDRVVREANPDRVAGRDGMDQLVRLGFSVRKSADGFALDGITTTQLELGAVSAQVPLAFAIVLAADGSAVVEAEYQTDVLAAPLVESMLGHFARLLDNAVTSPDRRIADLDMLGETDRAALLTRSHGLLVDEPATTLVALLESAAAASPDALALVSDDTELTYAALHARANRLAHWLIGEGIGSEDIVGLRLGTSVEFIVAVLAVLKAGAAYLPIDPAYPDDRIGYLVEDSKPRMLLGAVELGLAEEAAQELPTTAPADADRVRPLVPANLAYVIYTSGSTGKPKGVPVPHNAIAEHIVCFTADWNMTSADRLMQSSSVSFDASLVDIAITLTVGAQLIVPKPNAFRDIRYVADLISQRQVTVLHMVPSMLSTFLLLPEVSEWRSLRQVPVGGEALPGEVADRFANTLDAELRNHYGPTEAVVCSTHMPVTGPQGTGVVPIGVPNRNVYTYVLDAALQLVPDGVVGELYLGGAQLARGYLDRPALSAQRFVADPFTPGARLYRSGDLVRRNNFGELEFVGRADEQVKVRGFRIELGEVEAAIAAHPSVAHCVVIVTTDDTIGAMLAAYVVPAGDTVDLAEVQSFIAADLPEYMVPSAFAVIDEIPLTVNGKLDKRALPTATSAVVRTHRAPATATERKVCALFGTLFNLDKVGAEDSFFELGGHSLLAARLVAQIRAEFGIELDVRVIFDSPTPAALAADLVARFLAEFDLDLDAVDEPGDESAVDSAGAGLVSEPAATQSPGALASGGSVDTEASTDSGTARSQADASTDSGTARSQADASTDSGTAQSQAVSSSEQNPDAARMPLACANIDRAEQRAPAAFPGQQRRDVRPPITRRARGERIPLSYSQLAMWFQYRMEGASAVGNLPLALRFDGPLDIAALRSALDDVVARHESLRTTFPEHEGVPHQVIHPAEPVALPVRAIAEDEVTDTLAELASYSFALDGEPLLRAELLALDDETHVLSLLVHHIVADHASFGVLLTDLTAAYQARSRGIEPAWQPLDIQFADYAQWQRDQFDGAPSEFAGAQLEFWRNTLAGVPDEINVAHDRPRPPVLGKRGEVVTFALPSDVRNGLVRMASQVGATEFMVCEAAVATVLRALGGGDNIALGTPVAARTDAATTNLIGLFANMVVLRNNLASSVTLRDTVIHARNVVLDANGHQDLPIERLVEAVNPRRSRSRNPLFQSMIHFRGADWAPTTVPFGDATVTPLPTDFDVSFLDLNLSLNVTAEGGMDVRFVVNADLYDATTARSIADALATTLRAFADSPDLPLSDLTVLPADELARLRTVPEVVASATPGAVTAGNSTTEATLIALIEELLEIDDVEGDDNFFALGGDSVISIQWSARAEALGLPLSPQLVFECATIAELAVAVDAAATSAEVEQVSHAPMSASGLDDDALSALSAAWGSQ
ncbi:non-ribosomal peptide synthetase [Nocardia camponoti]|uniref:Carrier domain-containing protein n=1 Tax=Nocardia camponoti TaxID=1616106 RepID=A0A917QLW1_9NOCA|nr:non-ribosomal peptide synthetase [Nocardia camponoti]GGK57797.1 hypothetical protein GCM10011591_32490 [Nocardia camponoti]